MRGRYSEPDTPVENSNTSRQVHFFGAGPQVPARSQENTLRSTRGKRRGKRGRRVGSRRPAKR